MIKFQVNRHNLFQITNRQKNNAKRNTSQMNKMKIKQIVCLKFMKTRFLKIKIPHLGICNKLTKEMTNKLILIKLYLFIKRKVDN